MGLLIDRLFNIQCSVLMNINIFQCPIFDNLLDEANVYFMNQGIQKVLNDALKYFLPSD